MASATRDTLVLLASELITNAVRHAGPAAHDPAAMDDAIHLLLEHSGRELRMSVRDHGPGFVPVKANGNGHPVDGGRGLMLVEMLSSDWGVQSDPDGFTVWCTVDAVAA